MNLSASPGRPACPSRASGWSSLTTPWGLPCCVRFPCVHAVATTPAQRLGRTASLVHPQPYQPSPKGLSGRPAHRPFRGLLGVHSRYGLHTRAVTLVRDTLTGGFSHFVTSMTAPVASGWSGCRVGLTPTGKRRLSTAHTHRRHPESLTRNASREINGLQNAQDECTGPEFRDCKLSTGNSLAAAVFIAIT